jgi:hypothetical protein
MTIIKRADLGRPLTWDELDDNFRQVDELTAAASAAVSSASVSATAATGSAVASANSATDAANSAAAAAQSAELAEEYASNASEYAKNKFTFYKTSSDPDGTIAGLAATTDGQSFWVAQGPDALSAAWQYQNKAGVAVLQAKQPGTAAITGTIREFPTLEAAQADADAGNILSGATAFYRSPDDSTLAIEVMNVSGALQPTGRTMDAGGNIKQTPLSTSLVEFADPLGFSHSRIRSDGTFETPMSLLGENEISSGNLSIVIDPNFDDDLVLLSDELGFSIPITGDSGGGSVDPGEVTVDLPPQTAAYGLLSKMRAALEDVCIIINSDSTGITQDTDPSTGLVFKKWTRKLAEFLAGNYPAYTVNYYSWSSNAYTTPDANATNL